MSKDFARHYRINEERRQYKESKPLKATYNSTDVWWNYDSNGYIIYNNPSNNNVEKTIYKPVTVKNWKRFSNELINTTSILNYVNWINKLCIDKNLIDPNNKLVIFDENCSRVYFILDNLWITNKLISQGLKHAEICHYLLDFIMQHKPFDIKAKIKVMITYNMDLVEESKNNNRCNFVYKI